MLMRTSALLWSLRGMRCSSTPCNIPGYAATVVAQHYFGMAPCWNLAPVLLEPLHRRAVHFYVLRAVKTLRRPLLKLCEGDLVAIDWSAAPVQLILYVILLSNWSIINRYLVSPFPGKPEYFHGETTALVFPCLWSARALYRQGHEKSCST